MRSIVRYTLFALMITVASCSKKETEVPKTGTETSISYESPELDSVPDVYTDSTTRYITLFQSGKDGYAFFRIPALLRVKGGHLLAFAEGRRNGISDFGEIDIVMRKSSDGGKTWSVMREVAHNNKLQTDDPVPIFDNSDPRYPLGRVFLFYCTGNKPEESVLKLDGVKEVWYITSTDAGETWSKPTNITLQVHHPYQPDFNPAYNDEQKWGYYATGPGHGLQITVGKNKGRLVVPINHSVKGKGNFSSLFYSDDHGKSFKLAPDVPYQTGEVTAAELNNGGILLNSRNQYNSSRKNRILTYNRGTDFTGAGSWSGGFSDDLIEPVCQGSMINYTTPAKERVLLFSNPNSTVRREKVSVRQSFDEGASWSKGFLVDSTATSSAYSDLAIYSKYKIGILYETNYSGAIRFCLFDYRSIPKTR